MCIRAREKYQSARARTCTKYVAAVSKSIRCRFATMAIVDLRRVVNDGRTCRAGTSPRARWQRASSRLFTINLTRHSRRATALERRNKCSYFNAHPRPPLSPPSYIRPTTSGRQMCDEFSLRARHGKVMQSNTSKMKGEYTSDERQTHDARVHLRRRASRTSRRARHSNQSRLGLISRRDVSKE